MLQACPGDGYVSCYSNAPGLPWGWLRFVLHNLAPNAT